MVPPCFRSPMPFVWAILQSTFVWDSSATCGKKITSCAWGPYFANPFRVLRAPWPYVLLSLLSWDKFCFNFSKLFRSVSLRLNRCVSSFNCPGSMEKTLSKEAFVITTLMHLRDFMQTVSLLDFKVPIKVGLSLVFWWHLIGYRKRWKKTKTEAQQQNTQNSKKPFKNGLYWKRRGTMASIPVNSKVRAGKQVTFQHH